MEAPDMKAYMEGLIGQTLRTVDHGKPNKILAVQRSRVIVKTDRNEAGTASIREVQDLAERIFRADGKFVTFEDLSRGAFDAAVLDTMPEVEFALNPRRARLVKSSIKDMEPTSDPRALEERARNLGARMNFPVIPSHEAPTTVSATNTRFVRSPSVVAWVRQAASGNCEACGCEAPFQSGGEPFLEVHHVVPLGEGGWDHIDNAVAICPNCHRRCHYSDDRESLRESLYSKINRLVRPESLPNP